MSFDKNEPKKPSLEEDLISFYEHLLEYGAKNALTLPVLKSDAQAIGRLFLLVHTFYESIIELQKVASFPNGAFSSAVIVRSMVEYLAQMNWIVSDPKKRSDRADLFLSQSTYVGAVTYLQKDPLNPKAIEAIIKTRDHIRPKNKKENRKSKIILPTVENAFSYWFQAETGHSNLTPTKLVRVLEEQLYSFLPDNIKKITQLEKFDLYSEYSKIVHGSPCAICIVTNYDPHTKRIKAISEFDEFMKYYRGIAGMIYSFSMILIFGLHNQNGLIKELDDRFLKEPIVNCPIR